MLAGKTKYQVLLLMVFSCCLLDRNSVSFSMWDLKLVMIEMD